MCFCLINLNHCGTFYKQIKRPESAVLLQHAAFSILDVMNVHSSIVDRLLIYEWLNGVCHMFLSMLNDFSPWYMLLVCYFSMIIVTYVKCLSTQKNTYNSIINILYILLIRLTQSKQLVVDVNKPFFLSYLDSVSHIIFPFLNFHVTW